MQDTQQLPEVVVTADAVDANLEGASPRPTWLSATYAALMLAAFVALVASFTAVKIADDYSTGVLNRAQRPAISEMSVGPIIESGTQYWPVSEMSPCASVPFTPTWEVAARQCRKTSMGYLMVYTISGGVTPEEIVDLGHLCGFGQILMGTDGTLVVPLDRQNGMSAPTVDYYIRAGMELLRQTKGGMPTNCVTS